MWFSRLILAGLLWLVASPAVALQVVTASYTGDGTDNRNITISPPCQPVAVFVQRADSAWGGQVMFSSMPTNSSGEFTGTNQGQIDSIQQLNADGFQVGTTSYVNANGSPYRYAAFCDNGASDIAVGTYTGNATDDRNITISPAFSPEFVMILASNASYTAWRGASSHTGDAASIMNVANAEVANYIQAFNADGFQVGTGFNTNTINYYYVAVKGSAAGVKTGTFTGDGTDNRDITAAGFTPELVFIKGNSATKKVASRFGSTGDNSFCGDAVEAANNIQSLISTGFQVGTDTCANENAVAMRWAAFTDTSSPPSPKTYYVGKAGSDANSCATAQSAAAGDRKLTINSAIACLASGDTLTISADMYTEASTLYETTVSVPNGTAGNHTIIQGENYGIGCAYTEVCGTIIKRSGGPGSNFENASYITLRGITFDDQTVMLGYSDNCLRFGGTGTNILLEDVVFRNCADNGVFESALMSFLTLRRTHHHHAAQNPVNPGHGAYLDGDDTRIEDSWFHDNGLGGTNSGGVQIFNSSTDSDGRADRPVVLRSKFWLNDFGLVLDGEDGLAASNIIHDNRQDGFAAGYTGASRTKLFNNTIINNGGNGVYWGLFGPAHDSQSVNNHIAGNVVNQTINATNATNLTQTTNRIGGVATDCIVSNTDFHQKVGSLCTDGGTAVSGVDYDFYGAARTQGAAIDIGGSEYAFILPLGSSGSMARGSKGMVGMR